VGGGPVGLRDTASVHVRHTLHRIDGEWQLREPKTPKSRRTVTLPPVTVEALRAHRTRQLEERIAAGQPTAEGLVFVRADGRPYHGSKLTTLLYPVLDRLGLPKVSVHDLRHTASTILFDAGVDLEDVAKMLGHTDSRMLRERYVHVRPERSGAVAAAMERAMTG
jgi:integrase